MEYYVITFASGWGEGSAQLDIERDSDFDAGFIRPIVSGQQVTPRITAMAREPIRVRLEDRDSLPEAFGYTAQAWTVGPRVRSIIESIEPNVHTFIPVVLHDPKSNRTWTDYTILSVGKVVDAVNRQQSVFHRRGIPKSGLLKTVLDAQRLQDVHLWRGGVTKLGGGGDPFWDDYFCSGTLREALENGTRHVFFFNQCSTAVSGGNNVGKRI